MSLLSTFTEGFQCDEASGNLLAIISSSNDLTDNNTVAAAAGKIGGGRDFESTNSEFFNLAFNSTFATGNIDFEWSIWVKFESLSATQIIICQGQDVTTTNINYVLFFSSVSSRLVFRVVGGVTTTSVTANNFGALSTGVWYHVRVKHDPTADQISIAVNNGTPNTAAHSAGVNASAGTLYIGTDTIAGRYLDAVVDMPYLFKGSLSTQDRADLYNSGNALAYPFITSPIGPLIGPSRLIGGRLNRPTLVRT